MFLFSHWIQLSLVTRQKIASEFGIVQKHGIEVFENTVKNDGYEIKDIEQALNLDSIQRYLGSSETDMIKVWYQLIDKIEGREVVQTIEPSVEDKKSFCNTCDSKGVRHKLGCVQYKPTR